MKGRTHTTRANTQPSSWCPLPPQPLKPTHPFVWSAHAHRNGVAGCSTAATADVPLASKTAKLCPDIAKWSTE